MREDDLYESSWEEVTRETFSATWSEEVAAARQTVDSETIRLATGLLLPIWSALPSDHLVVNRIADKAGNSWLGRLVFDEHVVQLFTKLGIDRAEDLPPSDRSEEHTSELQSLMRISYAVFCLQKQTKHKATQHPNKLN